MPRLICSAKKLYSSRIIQSRECSTGVNVLGNIEYDCRLAVRTVNTIKGSFGGSCRQRELGCVALISSMRGACTLPPKLEYQFLAPTVRLPKTTVLLLETGVLLYLRRPVLQVCCPRTRMFHQCRNPRCARIFLRRSKSSRNLAAMFWAKVWEYLPVLKSF
jgi:hypothetical protein